MAFHHAVIITLICMWIAFTTAYMRRDTIPLRQLRPTRGFDKLNSMDLSIARGYGKRAENTHFVNNFLLKWIALETRMRGLGYPRNTEYMTDFSSEQLG